MRRRAFAAALGALLLAVAGAGRAAEGDVEETPWDGVLPDVGRDDVAATRIVDGDGRPVPGARLRRLDEDVDPRLAVPAPLLGVGRADDAGFAWVPLPQGAQGDAHWLADAPGFVPTHEYGARPPDRMVLRPGVDVRARVLDARGRPIAGAAVDAYMNCSHGPSVGRATTGADGTFALAGLPRTAWLWVAARGSAAEVFDVDDVRGLGTRVRDLVLAPGRVARGRVVDPAGAPVAGVVVRTFGSREDRGVVGVTDADGVFEVTGISDRRTLWFHHPRGASPSSPSLGDEDWADGVALTVPLTKEGFWRPDAPLVEVRVRPRGSARRGSAVVRLVRKDDGRAFEESLAEEGPDVGAAVFALPPGRYEASAGSAFAAESFGGTVDVAAGGPREHAVESSPRPRLVVECPARPDLDGLLVSVAGEPAEGAPGDGLHVPDDAEAVVRATEGGVTFFAPAGPPTDGVRGAALTIPPPRSIRLEGADADAEPAVVLASDPAQRVAGDWVAPAFRTRAEGSLVVRFAAGGEPREARVDLPADAAGDVVVRAADARPAPGRMVAVRASLADGTPARAKISYETPTGGSGFSSAVDWPIAPPFFAIVESEGLQPVAITVNPGDEPHVRWGTGFVRLSVRGPDGAPVAARVALDGWLHDLSDEAPLEVRGLHAGAHEAFVVATDGDLRGVRVRFTLREGEAFVREVRLAAKPSR